MDQTVSEPIIDKQSVSVSDTFALFAKQGWLEGAHTVLGQNIAKYCSAYLHEQYARDLQRLAKSGFLGTDEDLKNDSQFANGPSSCTAVTATITPENCVYVENAGDSRAVISTDASRFVEFGRVNGNLALSRAIGGFEFKQNPNLSPGLQIGTVDNTMEKKICKLYSDVCVKDPVNLWKNGIVPYQFDRNITSGLKQTLMLAMRMISDVSSIEFKERTDQEDYIYIVDNGMFQSFVGRRGGKQELSVTLGSPNFNLTGSSIHELMHTLGFYHEHSRPDRDEYVKIIDNGDDNFKKFRVEDVTCYGQYDLESIMHYPVGRFPQGEQLWLKEMTNMMIGQRNGLSIGDIRALNRLYPAKNIVRFIWAQVCAILQGGILCEPLTLPSHIAEKYEYLHIFASIKKYF